MSPQQVWTITLSPYPSTRSWMYHAKDFSRTFATGRVELEIDPEYALEVKDEAWIDDYTIFVE